MEFAGAGVEEDEAVEPVVSLPDGAPLASDGAEPSPLLSLFVSPLISLDAAGLGEE